MGLVESPAKSCVWVETLSIEDARWVEPRSARGDSKAIVARSAVGGARREFELDPTLTRLQSQEHARRLLQNSESNATEAVAKHKKQLIIR